MRQSLHLIRKGDGSVSRTKDVEFDYQAYMKDYVPDPDKIHWGLEARQKRREAAIHNNWGLAYYEKGNYDCAIEEYTKAIELNPNYAIAYNNRGVTYAKKSKYDRAVEDFNMAINLKPNYVHAYNNRGLAYRGKGDFDRAIEDYTKAIQLKPDYAIAYNNRGVTYGDKGDFDRAIEDYTKAIEIKPDYIEAYDNRRRAFDRKRDLNSNLGMVDYTKAIQQNPDNPQHYYNRGEVCLHIGKWKKAIEDLTTARNMGADIIALFRNSYASVTHFEQINQFKLPADIAAMLTPQQ